MEPFIPVNTIIAFILLCVVIYVGLKDNDKFDPEQLTEAVGFQNDLPTGTYNLRHRIDECKPRTAVEVKECITKVYGINVYEGYVGDTRILLSAEDVY